MRLCVCVIYMRVCRFLTFPVFPSKGWKVNYARKPKQPHLLHSVPLFSPAIRMHLFALWVSCAQRMCVRMCAHVCGMSACNQTPVCLPCGPSSPLIMYFWMTKTRTMYIQTQIYCFDTQTCAHTHKHTRVHRFYIPSNHYSVTRPIPETDGRKGEVHFSLSSTMSCLLLQDPRLYVCVCVCVCLGLNFFIIQLKSWFYVNVAKTSSPLFHQLSLMLTHFIHKEVPTTDRSWS